MLAYHPKLKKLAQQLRKNSTFSEVLLWRYLKKKQMCGLDFNRQKPIGYYIVDFYNCKYRMAIEIDGSSHEGKEEYDARRDAYLEEHGVRVLHIRDEDVKRDMTGVLWAVEKWVRLNTPGL